MGKRTFQINMCILLTVMPSMIGLAFAIGAGIPQRWPELCTALLLAGLLPVQLSLSALLHQRRPT